jgi:hypothetical protein
LSRGIARERAVVKLHHLVDGWAARCGVGGGKVDVIHVKGGLAHFIQSKSTIGPYSHFGPREREVLLLEAAQAGVPPERVLLYWWPKGGKLKVIPSTEWPS